MRVLAEEVLRGERIRVEVLASNVNGRTFWSAVGFGEYALTLEREPT